METTKASRLGGYSVFLRGDLYIWLALVALALVSLVEVYSASEAYAYRVLHGDTTSVLLKQFGLLSVGVLSVFVVQMIPTRRYKPWVGFLLWASIGLLLFTFFKGMDVNSARRSFRLVGVTIQASELVKIPLVLYLAVWLSKSQESLADFQKGVLKPLVYIGIVCALTVRDNMSMAALLFAISIFMLTVGNVRVRHLLMIGVGVVGLAVLLLFVRIPGLNSIQNRLQRRATWEGRLQNFANGELDEGQGTQAKIAVAGGLWFGKGVGKSTQRVILPEAHKDFIYAIIIEEFGFLGGLAVMAIYLLLMWRIRIITLRSKSAYQAYLCAGIGFMICFQAFVHAFICVGLLPVTGLPLPFVSLGGNSIFVTGVGLGMVQSVARQQAKEFYEGELAESNEVQ